MRTLRLNMTGEDVAALQRALVAVGYQGAVGGVFGPRTQEAVEALQGAFDLPATGRADAPTRAALAQIGAAPEIPDTTARYDLGARQWVARVGALGEEELRADTAAALKVEIIAALRAWAQGATATALGDLLTAAGLEPGARVTASRRAAVEAMLDSWGAP